MLCDLKNCTYDEKLSRDDSSFHSSTVEEIIPDDTFQYSEPNTTLKYSSLSEEIKTISGHDSSLNYVGYSGCFDPLFTHLNNLFKLGAQRPLEQDDLGTLDYEDSVEQSLR